MTIHGVALSYRNGCRCPKCTHAHTGKVKAWRLITHDGRSPMKRDITGARRRLQALVALGWTLESVSHKTGIPVPALKRVTYGMVNKCQSETFRRISDAYDRLSGTVPPPGRYTTRARTLAARRAWVPPLAWDDIDNDPNPADLDYYTRRMSA